MMAAIISVLNGESVPDQPKNTKPPILDYRAARADRPRVPIIDRIIGLLLSFGLAFLAVVGFLYAWFHDYAVFGAVAALVLGAESLVCFLQAIGVIGERKDGP